MNNTIYWICRSFRNLNNHTLLPNNFWKLNNWYYGSLTSKQIFNLFFTNSLILCITIHVDMTSVRYRGCPLLGVSVLGDSIVMSKLFKPDYCWIVWPNTIGWFVIIWFWCLFYMKFLFSLFSSPSYHQRSTWKLQSHYKITWTWTNFPITATTSWEPLPTP